MRDWLNLTLNRSGTVPNTGVEFTDRVILGTATVDFDEVDVPKLDFAPDLEKEMNQVRILEVERSGAIFVDPSRRERRSGGDDDLVYGDLMVYLVLMKHNQHGAEVSRFLSAPLHTTLAVDGVLKMQLVVAALAGPPGTEYSVSANAHVVFETQKPYTLPESWFGAGEWPHW